MKQVYEIGLSALPWHLSVDRTVVNASLDAADGVAPETRVCLTEREEDARFIVHTPRLYAELVCALPNLRRFLEMVQGQPFDTRKLTMDLQNQIASIEEVLRLASGEEES